MKENRIFIVEDDPSIRFGLEEIFRGEGYVVECCEEGTSAEEAISTFLPDLLLLDVMLPGKNGYEICKSLRRNGCRMPIVMLTAKGQEIDKVIGLDSGADDYVTKPFGVQELVARVKAHLRRFRYGNGGETELQSERKRATSFQIGKAIVHAENYEVELDGARARLTPKEMELLRFFDENRSRVLTRDELLENVWGVRYFGTTRTLDQCVAQLRKKIGDTGQSPEYLMTVHGVGYRLE